MRPGCREDGTIMTTNRIKTGLALGVVAATGFAFNVAAYGPSIADPKSGGGV